MKTDRLFISVLLALASFTVSFAGEYAGKLYDVGSKATTIEAGKLYFMYNNSTKKFAYEGTDNLLHQGTTPKAMDVESNLGYMFQLETSADYEGKYFVKTGLGRYVSNPSSSKSKATITEGYPMTISEITGGSGNFSIKGNMYYLSAPSTGADLIGASTAKLGNSCDWSFYEVKFTSVSELKGQNLYKYQMQQSLIKLYNKRISNYLTASKGSVYGAAKAKTGFSQIWIKEADDTGWTLRSAETGEYLTDDFGTPGDATKLYMKYSPNNTNTNTDAWGIISSEADFSGQKCLNLGNDGKTLYKWSYAGDAGCDWGIDLVTDVTEEEIRDHLNQAKGWAKEIEDGAYYRIVSTHYNLDMTEMDGNLKSVKRDENKLTQCWQIRKSGDGYTFQNVVTENYASQSPGTSQYFTTNAQPHTFFIKQTTDKWSYSFTITQSQGASAGMHTASSQSNYVVLWSTDASASVWAFEKVNLTQEQIDKARAAEKEYARILANKAKYQTTLNTLFEDKACTTLKSSVAAMTDAQVEAIVGYSELPQAIKDMVMKVKNDTWKVYKNSTSNYEAGLEKFFRVADYQVYSNHSEMCWLTGMSNNYGKLSNPTGITVESGDILFVYVEEDPKNGCTLQLERVSTGDPGSNRNGPTTNLNAGLNIIRADAQANVFIYYQLNNTDKLLANYPDIKVHIEGGTLNGYFDATRGMTNDDWKLMINQKMLQSPVINLKGEHIVFCMNSKIVKETEPNNIEGTVRIWNKIIENEESYMGLDAFDGRLRNVWNAFSINYSYMYAGDKGSYFNETTLPTIMKYSNLANYGSDGHEGGAMWGPSHEFGHNHQSAHNLIGATESSNNLFSNINTFETGISSTRYRSPQTNFGFLPKNQTWLDRDITVTTRMYFQLWLYFHNQGYDTTFYPRLFKALRANPMHQNGKNSGREDYLHFAKLCCDVAQADLSEFFEAYGFFVPVENYEVGDYSTYYVTTTQADIDAALKYMHKYPKKYANLMFIDDHIIRHDSDPDNKFGCDATGNGGKKWQCCNYDGAYYGKSGDGGDYESYDRGTDYLVDNDYFTLSSSTITFKGTGWMGHKFYDKQTGRLVWACNSKSASMPSSVKTLLTNGNLIVVAAERNGEDVLAPYYKVGQSAVYKYSVVLRDKNQEKMWYTNADGFLGYIPENAIAQYIDNREIPEAVKAETNVIYYDPAEVETAGAARIVINGDMAFCMPDMAIAQKLSFTKTNDGYAVLSLPFAVQGDHLNTGYTTGDTFVVTPTNYVGAGEPLVVNGNVAIELEMAHLLTGSYKAQEDVFVMSADGKSITKQAASPFTYVFDKAYNVDFATAINDVKTDDNGSQATSTYNLQGQRVSENGISNGIYIINGQKKLIK